MENILLPSKIEIKKGENKNQGIVVIEPLYMGYGTTLGNALRRVLLSSLPGAAVTAIKIKGVQHEFSTVSNVKEDVIEIILNLKQLRLEVFSDEPVRLILKAKGEKEVTAKDIEANSNVEIMNPELKIATLTDKTADFEMEIFVEKGRGYVTTDARQTKDLEIGTIAIDSIFNPVRNVGFQVKNTRVGQITNYDKLILTIETDGTITPEDALGQATKILIDHFTLISGGKVQQEDEEVEEVKSTSTADKEEKKAKKKAKKEEKKEKKETKKKKSTTKKK